jgi:hypothetical protein
VVLRRLEQVRACRGSLSDYWSNADEVLRSESNVVSKNRKHFALNMKTELELFTKFETGVYVKR